MRLLNFISPFFVLSLTIILFSCKTAPKMTFVVSSFDTSIVATKISISELAKNYKSYHGQYIETKGRFYQSLEEFAIYTDKSILSGDASGFWLSTDQKLNIDNLSFNKMNGQKITIKGIVDTTSKGHLSSYLAAIERIYFWQK